MCVFLETRGVYFFFSLPKRESTYFLIPKGLYPPRQRLVSVVTGACVCRDRGLCLTGQKACVCRDRHKPLWNGGYVPCLLLARPHFSLSPAYGRKGQGERLFAPEHQRFRRWKNQLLAADFLLASTHVWGVNGEYPSFSLPLWEKRHTFTAWLSNLYCSQWKIRRNG